MSDLTREFLAYAKEKRADLVGIAPIERFAGLPPERHPASIFPEVKSVVVVGKRIPRGSLRGVEEGTQFGTYHNYGYGWLEDRFLATTTSMLGEFLEDHRWEAVPLLNLPPEMEPMGVAVVHGRAAPNVLMDMDDAAVRAGLGEIGYLETFVTPQYGPRQRFYAILTDAPLDPTPIFGGTICERSKAFAKFCPLGAIDPNAEKTIEIAGKSMKVAGIDYKICAQCKNGAQPNRRHASGKPDRMAAVCMRSYMAHLEKGGKLENTFVNAFRKRPAWTVHTDRLVSQEGSEIE